MNERLTRNQLGALHEASFRDRLTAGWGGYSLRTLRSLEDRGLMRTSDGERFSVTQKGHDLLASRSGDQP